MPQPLIALLGRRDEPTDAVEEYCTFLGESLAVHDIQLEIERVSWNDSGWPDALNTLRLQAVAWQNTWVLVQYTALAWSARGFPSRFIRVLRLLASARARIAVLFHDVEPYVGSRLVGRIRRLAQIHTMRRALKFADLVIFTVPSEKLSWVSGTPQDSVFIPVGANLPVLGAPKEQKKAMHAPLNVGVFSITGGEAGGRETRAILGAIRFASRELGSLRLSVFGRHAELRETELREGLRDLPVEVAVDGVLDEDCVVEKLYSCDVVLFVRGGISTRRGSAIAAIACGVPLIAYSGSETSAPITGAGVILVAPDRPEELQAALVRVLSDSELRANLAAASRAAYQRHFSWSAIAARFAGVLKAR